jgi:hypothetical protein
MCRVLPYFPIYTSVAWCLTVAPFTLLLTLVGRDFECGICETCTDRMCHLTDTPDDLLYDRIFHFAVNDYIQVG